MFASYSSFFVLVDYFLNSSGCFRRCATRLVVVNDFIVCPPLEMLVLCKSCKTPADRCRLLRRTAISATDMIVRPPGHVHSSACVRNRPYLQLQIILTDTDSVPIHAYLQIPISISAYRCNTNYEMCCLRCSDIATL